MYVRFKVYMNCIHDKYTIYITNLEFPNMLPNRQMDTQAGRRMDTGCTEGQPLPASGPASPSRRCRWLS